MAEQIFTAAEQALIDVMNQHQYAEFVLRDPEAAMSTMIDEPYVINFPAGSGGYGKAGVRDFYTNHFIPNIPPDFEVTHVISQTVGQNRLVMESVGRFTHSIRMDWMLPGIEPTFRVVELTIVGIIQFQDGKLASEHLYWDQLNVLAQLGVIDGSRVPVIGSRSSQLAINPASVRNELVNFQPIPGPNPN